VICTRNPRSRDRAFPGTVEDATPAAILLQWVKGKGDGSMKKRLLIGVLAAASTFATVFGMAASLNMSADALGASSAAVSACDANGITTSYADAWDTTDNRYEVSTVTVGGIADSCNGKDVKVTLTDNTGARIAGADGTGTASTTGGTADNRSLTITLATAAAVSSVNNVSVVIG
jgi:hypothetical protein